MKRAALAVVALAGACAGTDWAERAVPEERQAIDVWVSEADDVWVMGDRLHHFDGQAWEAVSEGCYAEMWSPAPGELWVFCNGSVRRWSGGAWTTLVDLDCEGMLWGASASDVWVFCAPGDGPLAPLHWDGAAWTADPDAPVLAALWGRAPDEYWGVALDGAVYRFDGAGWNPSGSIDVQGSLQIFGAAAGPVWILAGGLLWQWDGGAWIRDPAQPWFNARAAWASGPDDIWLAGNEQVPYAPQDHIRQSTIGHFDGAEWDTWAFGYEIFFQSVSGSAPGRPWAAGNRDYILPDGNGASTGLALEFVP